MGLRFRNIQEVDRVNTGAVLHGGAVSLYRTFFDAEVEAFIVMLTTPLTPATSIVVKLTDATSDLTLTGEIVAADAAGKRIIVGGNGTQIVAGAVLTLDIVETGAVVAGVADIMTIFRKTEGGRPVDWAPTT